MTSEKAWVTLATNDTYSLGALVLAHSLKKVKTSHKLVVLITSNVSSSMRGLLQGVYDEVKEVNLLDSGDAENLRLLARPELGVTFTKLHCWRLTQYEKCVFLDADTLVLQNCDELFDREELSAAPDVGWPDCFNSGVFVFKPSEETYQALINFALTHGSFDGGDQGLFNMFFSGWSTGDSSKRLPFLFNLSSAAIYSYLPAFKWYGKGVKIVHFIGGSKPWLQPFNPVTRQVQTDHSISHLNNFMQYWWDLFCAQVHPNLTPEMTRLLLRNWITPQIPFKNYSYQNSHSRINIKSQHDDAIVSETIERTQNESHFVFTDPWDEYESSLVDNIENFHSCSNSNDIPAVVEVTLVENRTYYPPKNEEHFFQNTSNDRNTVIVEDNKDNLAFFDNFRVQEHVVNQPEISKAEHQPEISKTEYQPEISKTHHLEISTTRNCQDSHNTEIHRPITSPCQSDQSEKCSSSFTVNTNINLSPPAVDVLPKEKEISNSKVDLNEESGLAQSLSQMKLEEPTPEQLAQEDLQRRLNWEQGNIDYMGKDSFDNIWSKISQSVSQAEESPASDKVLDAVSPAATVSPTQVTSTPAVPPVAVPAEPVQQPAPVQTPADLSKTESPAAKPEIKSSPPSASSDPKEIVEPVKEVPASPTTKEAQPATPSPTEAPVCPIQKAQLPATPSPTEAPVCPIQKPQLPATPTQKPAESVTPSSVPPPQPESAPVCVKPSPVEKQISQSEKAAPTQEAPPKSLPQAPKPAEPSSITPLSPKSPEAPTTAPDFSKKPAADVQPTAATSTSTDPKSATPAVPAPVEAKPEPSVPAQSTPTAQEAKSKQTPKSGGGKKK